MKLYNHYLRLHACYGESEQTAITLAEVAAALDCTQRNAVTIVRGMREQGWIVWSAQRGRGHRSKLRFLVPPEQVALLSMMQAINRKRTLFTLDRFSDSLEASGLKERMENWLLTYFGHHAEIQNDKQVDTLRLPVRHKLHTIDPLYMNLLAESFVSSHVFDGLIQRDGSKDGISPNVAHAWETNGDRTLWTFYLRKEVPMHNGGVLTADDVVYSLERLIRTPHRTLYSFVYKQIRSVRALNATTVQIALEEPNELFLPFLCTSRAAIVPRPMSLSAEPFSSGKPIGTGPFQIVEMEEHICVLRAFRNYFRGRAHLDHVEIVHVPVDMQSGSGDAGETSSPFHIIHNPNSLNGTWSSIHSEVSIRKFITCNARKAGPLSDLAVRTRIVSSLRGEAVRFETAIALQLATIPQYKADAEFVAERLGRSGCRCTVTTVSPEEFKGSIRLESDLILFSLVRDQDDQLRRFDQYLTITEHLDSSACDHIERRLRDAAREPASAVRTALLDGIEAWLMLEHHLFILSEKPVQTAHLPSVRGVAFNGQGWVDLRNIWFPPITE